MKSLVLFVAMTIAAVATANGTPTPIPVQVGGNEDIDACPSLAQVGGAKSGMISVRSGPGDSFPEIARLRNGDFAYDCDSSGEWEGVVYGMGRDPLDCDVASPMSDRGAYKGKCKSGWVRRKWLTVVAG